MSIEVTRIYLNIGVDEMTRQVMAMVDKYSTDGLVMHSTRSCKPYALGQDDIQRLVRESKGIPTLLFDADMVDERSFAEGQIATRIETFIELLDARQGRSGKGAVTAG